MIKIMNIRQMQIKKVTFVSFVFLIFTFYICAMNSAAQEKIPSNAAPPPIKAVPTEDKKRLEAERDVKKRVVLALEMMGVRLKNAENLNTEEQYTEMFKQLGYFHAMMDNTLDFLERNNAGGNKILRYYKRFELNLRDFIARLELIRRELPVNYEYYVRTLVKAVRDARTRAVEPIFGDTVLPNQS